MRRKSPLLFMLAIALATLFIPKPVFSPSTTVVGTQPLPCTAAVGIDFDVDITVADVQDLYGWEINMTFNPTVLNVVDMVEGPFLIDFADLMGVGTWPLGPLIDNNVGWVQMSDSLFPIPDPPDGADGDGVLATITFHAVAYGTATLHFSDTLLNTNVGGLPTPIDHTVVDGWFDNRITGDANADKTVNVFDILAVKSRWGRTPASPDWIPDYDVNYDQAINVFDILTVKANWGHTAP